jgi:hypothetical protein
MGDRVRWEKGWIVVAVLAFSGLMDNAAFTLGKGRINVSWGWMPRLELSQYLIDSVLSGSALRVVRGLQNELLIYFEMLPTASILINYSHRLSGYTDAKHVLAP